MKLRYWILVCGPLIYGDMPSPDQFAQNDVVQTDASQPVTQPAAQPTTQSAPEAPAR